MMVGASSMARATVADMTISSPPARIFAAFLLLLSDTGLPPAATLAPCTTRGQWRRCWESSSNTPTRTRKQTSLTMGGSSQVVPVEALELWAAKTMGVRDSDNFGGGQESTKHEGRTSGWATQNPCPVHLGGLYTRVQAKGHVIRM